MAQMMICDGCGELPADLLIQNIHNGDVMAFCVSCSGLWAKGHADAVLDEVGPEVPDTVPQPLESDSGTVDTFDLPPDSGTDRAIGEIVESAPRPAEAKPSKGASNGTVRKRSSGTGSRSRKSASEARPDPGPEPVRVGVGPDDDDDPGF